MAKKILELVEEEFKIKILPIDKKIVKKAFEYQQKFNLGIFDSFHAATCFFSDKKILSTDKIYDRIKDLERIDPRELFSNFSPSKSLR